MTLLEVADTEVEKDKEVRDQIAWCEPEVFTVEHVATMFVNSLRVRTSGHDKKAASKAPKVSVAGAWERVTDSGEDAHVEVTADEGNVVLYNESVKMSE